nr:TIR domain-containing protein [Hyphomonas sp. Mor2]
MSVEVSKPDEKLKVFISYSRADVSGADELELALSDKGFEVLIDRHGILPGDDWRTRLGELILGCDTVIFLLSDTSAVSEICNWEVEEAKRLGKRMLVATIGETSPSIEPPPDLKGINWIHCWPNPAVPGSGLIRGVLELEQALQTDFEWLRDRTNYQGQARRWILRTDVNGEETEGLGATSLLLRGESIAEALEWARLVPRAETIPNEVNRFLEASEQHEQELQALAKANVEERENALKSAERAQKRLRNFSFIALIVGVILMLSSAAGGYLAWMNFQNAKRQTQYALNYQEIAREQTFIAARKSSDVLARMSKELLEDSDSPELALLMALQADPLNKKLRRLPQSDTPLINELALAGVAAATANFSLVHLLELEGVEIKKAVYSGDGETIVTGHEDGGVAVWNALDGKVRYSKSEHAKAIWTLAVSPDGSHFASGDTDGVANVWRVRDGKLIAQYLASDINASWTTGIDFSAEHDLVAIGKKNGEVFIVSSDTKQIIQTLSDPGEDVLAVAISPDGTSVAAAFEENSVLVWDTETGALLWEFDGLARPPTTLAFSSDGLQLGFGTFGPMNKYWDFTDGGKLKSITEQDGWRQYELYSPNLEHHLRIDDGKVRVWDRTLESPVYIDPPMRAELRAVSPDGQHLAISDGKRRIAILDAQNGQTLKSIRIDYDLMRTSSIRQIGFSPDGTELFAATIDGVHWWNVRTGESSKHLGGRDNIVSVAYSPDESLIMSVDYDGPARIWNGSDQSLRLALPPLNERILVAVFSPDGRKIVTGESDGIVSVRDSRTAEVEYSFKAHQKGVRFIDFSANGEFLITGSTDAHINVWRGDSQKPHFSLPLRTNKPSAISIFEASGRSFLVAPWNTSAARIWDLRTGETIMELETSATLGINAAYLVPGTRSLFSVHGTYDRPVSLWQLPDSLFASPSDLVQLACSKLLQTNSPLAFKEEELRLYRVLEGEPIDPETGDFESPCKDNL